MTVSWRRSAVDPDARSSSKELLTGNRETCIGSFAGSPSVRNAAIASSSWRRWPTEVTPRSLRSSTVRLGRTTALTSFSRNVAS